MFNWTAFSTGQIVWKMSVSRSVVFDSETPWWVFSVAGILQARTLEWVAIPLNRVSFQPRDWTRVSYIGRQILYCLSHQGSPDCMEPSAKKYSEGILEHILLLLFLNIVTFLKQVFIEFVTVLFISFFFNVLVFWPQGMWNVISLIRVQTCNPSTGRWSLNRWTTREVLCTQF